MVTSPGPELRTCGRWLTRDRVVFYSCVLLLIDLSLPFIHLYGRYSLHNTHIANPGWDFAVFWSASYLTIHGEAASAFDWVQIEQLARPLQGLTFADSRTPWAYPPTFLLVVWPFAYASFLFSYLAFVLAGLLFAAFACTQLVRNKLPSAFWLAAAAFPPVWIASVAGQNSFLTAGLMALGLALLDRRPRLAGVCFGLLVIKPQLGVLIPIALVVGRRWRTLAAAAYTASLLCLAAGAVLGIDVYVRFFDTASVFREYIVERIPYWPTGMPTVFGAAHRMGLSIGIACVIHGAVATIAVTSMSILWIRNARDNLRAAALVIASMLCQPYLLSYDFIWMGLSLLLLWQDGARHGWRPPELAVLIVAWLSPIVFFLPTRWPAGNVMPVVMLALLAIIVMRSRTAEAAHPVAVVEACSESYT
jgi:hypothetical protein